MQPDPSLGLAADFPVDDFETAIRFSMQMGYPKDPDRRPKFVRKGTERTYWKDGVQLADPPRLDRDGNPFDPDVEVRKGTDTIVAVPKTTTGGVDCAIEVVKADSDEIPVGNFRPTKAEVTVLSSDYAAIAGCQELRYNGDRYQYGYEPEAPGLFGSGINVLIFYCLDDG